ncbi:MAG: DnaA regulatory inactivator Hda [Gammaproteobacteria bacterium]|nr:DnaA regulatory inactivator Hda [Gammaproteobacteria bacterium]
MFKQLALDLQLRETYTLDNFITGDNALVIELLRQAVAADGEQQLYLWGDVFTGKSHLLQALCQLAIERQLTISYLPFKQLIDYSPEVLEGLEVIDLICIDDVQMVAGRADWQLRVFDLINRIRESGKQLVFAADLPPNELNIQLEDLRSRLNWGPVLRLQGLDDQDKQRALQLRASLRGFELSEQTANFILKNYARDLAGLFDRLEQLDKVSLAEQRRLTIPFVKSVFES